jgi:hypothetical protein
MDYIPFPENSSTQKIPPLIVGAESGRKTGRKTGMTA